MPDMFLLYLRFTMKYCPKRRCRKMHAIPEQLASPLVYSDVSVSDFMSALQFCLLIITSSVSLCFPWRAKYLECPKLKPFHIYMTWLTGMEYMCRKWPRICSTCRQHMSVCPSFMTVCTFLRQLLSIIISLTLLL